MKKHNSFKQMSKHGIDIKDLLNYSLATTGYYALSGIMIQVSIEAESIGYYQSEDNLFRKVALWKLRKERK